MNYLKIIKSYFLRFPSLIYLSIFLLFLPVALGIQFQHNDDWIYYLSVLGFLNGNFVLDPYIAATTYSQTALGTLFSMVFGITYLPVLTMFVSILSVYYFFKILNIRLKVKFLDSFLLSLILLFNGIFVFTAIGFMTDNYFLCFFLASIYYLFDDKLYEAKNLKSLGFNFLLGSLFLILAYFTRQLGMLIPLALFIWLLLNKKTYYALINLFLFIIVALYHFFIFPKHSISLEDNFLFSNLLYLRYIYSLFSALLFYFGFFCMPLVFPNLLNFDFKNKKWIYFLIGAIIFYFFNLVYFKSIWWVGSNDFALRYVFQTKGFFVENLAGVKNGIFLDPFFYVRTFGRIIVATFVVYLLFYRKFEDFFNPYSILLILYLGTFFIIEKIYDRYLIPAFPLFILALSKNYLIENALSGIRRRFLILFLIFIGFISYNYASDYILTNNYVWGKSMELVRLKVNPRAITATDAWRYLYPRKNGVYKFTYDNPKLQEYSTKFELVDSYEIKYPLQLLNNTVYLYKLK